MDCEKIRAALSARLDGENSTLPDELVDAHLEGCEDCQRWYATVTALGRQLRMTSAPPCAPSIAGQEAAARVLGAAESFPQVTGNLRARQLPLLVSRILLAVLATVYIGWAAVLLFGSTVGVAGGSNPAAASAPYGASSDPMLARFVIDAATARFALGAGLAWACFRPRSAGALLPVYLGMWAFGAGFATRDVVLGLIEYSSDLPSLLGSLFIHLLAVIALLGCWLARINAVTPLRQSWRWLTARPMNFSATDVQRNSTYRPGD
ncbi:hypothetical protein GSS87_06420 [Corynebacterium sp. 4HC-13]|uniref:Uncharacterized protein n=2 Tax=Corynebacterium anserum TaxID=2684406 RepID=A0A7G7YPH9_9CORY|nr:zf-HC2 domain-containing protein [Corynebacterium anserum]MBC2682028.1 hypothetical protein [Corynebacterium anserum]QNH96399.1 hypothetical protein GP473_06795 [Corynebacterium anserum]